MSLIHGLRFDNIKNDVFGGLTASVVALPLALAFGVASGAGAMAGLYGAIFVGFFSALLGGTPTQISGPTGPMTVMMAVIITQYSGHPALAFTIVIMGGALQILFGWLRLGRYVTYMPFSVISGFMTGIGVIIILLQLSPLLGHPAASGGVIKAITNIPNLFSDSLGNGAILGFLSLLIVSFTPKAIGKIIPSPMLALISCTFLSATVLPGAPLIGDIPTEFPSFILPTISLTQLPHMIQLAFILALLGSIDSLLTSLVADNFTRSQHDSNRELIGQGIGNMVAGFFGAIPGAGATMRTVINIRTGGRTPISGILHSLILLALVLGMGPLAEQIPHSVLAGILLKVGWDIIDWDHLKRLKKAPLGGVAVTITVLVLTVVANLVTAVGVGVIMAALISASQLSEQQLSQFKLVTSEAQYTPIPQEGREILRWADGRILVLHLSGPFSFCSAKGMVRQLSTVDEHYEVVILDVEAVSMIDTSIAMALEEIIQQCSKNGRAVFLTYNEQSIEKRVLTTLTNMGVLDLVPEGHRHSSRLEALRHAKKVLESKPTMLPLQKATT